MGTVDKNSTSLTAFPDEIPEDTEELLLYANKIKKVPPSIGKLKKLKVLNCFNNAIGLSLPDEIGTLAELTEVNMAANKLAMLKDVHFSSWSKVTVLNLNDNNLSAIGSLAPLVALEELRAYGCQLTAMPTLASPSPELKIIEVHKNRITDPPDDYFAATPALERLSVWGNALTTLPTSLTKCGSLIGVQAQTNPITRLPDADWPASLETIFLQETKLTALPSSLKKNTALKRVNITGVNCDDELAKALEALVLKHSDAIFWDRTGKQTKA